MEPRLQRRIQRYGWDKAVRWPAAAGLTGLPTRS